LLLQKYFTSTSFIYKATKKKDDGFNIQALRYILHNNRETRHLFNSTLNQRESFFITDIKLKLVDVNKKLLGMYLLLFIIIYY
jgi:hypothetical protein